MQSLVEDTNQELAVSYISLMEIAIKKGTGKLNYSDTLYDDLDMLDITILSPSRADLEQYQIYSPANKDPFDNLLITSATNGRYLFLTADRKIIATKAAGFRTIDANG